MFLDALTGFITAGGGLWAFLTLLIVGPVDLGVLVLVVLKKINPIIPDLSPEEQFGYRLWLKREGAVEAAKAYWGSYGPEVQAEFRAKYPDWSPEQ